jgi:hypothetical protein
MYEKISTVIVFDASKKILGEEYHSRSVSIYLRLDKTKKHF